MSSLPTALIWVLAEPSSKVSEAEYNDWCDEHIPLRLALPVYHSGIRLVEADGEKPVWSVLYDIESYQATKEEPYGRLALTHSERETDLLSRIGVLDKRTYELYQGHPLHQPSALYKEGAAAPFYIFMSMEVMDSGLEDFHKWYDEEHIPLMSKVPVWIRSRRFVLKDSSIKGLDVQEEKVPPKFLAIHEFAAEPEFGGKEFQAAINTPWELKVLESVITREKRMFKHYNYKSYQKTD